MDCDEDFQKTLKDWDRIETEGIIRHWMLYIGHGKIVHFTEKDNEETELDAGTKQKAVEVATLLDQDCKDIKDEDDTDDVEVDGSFSAHGEVKQEVRTWPGTDDPVDDGFVDHGINVEGQGTILRSSLLSGSSYSHSPLTKPGATFEAMAECLQKARAGETIQDLPLLLKCIQAVRGGVTAIVKVCTKL